MYGLKKKENGKENMEEKSGGKRKDGDNVQQNKTKKKYSLPLLVFLVLFSCFSLVDHWTKRQTIETRGGTHQKKKSAKCIVILKMFQE